MSTTPRLALPLPLPTDSMAPNPPAFANLFNNLDPAMGAFVCTSSTRPPSPYAYEWIYQTDTNEHFIWDTSGTPAWVKISSNPTGIIGVNNTATNTPITATGTRYLVSSINGLAVEQNRNYRIHVEGVFGFTASGSMFNQPTQNGQLAIHVATSGSVTVASTIQQNQHCDTWAQDNGVSGLKAQSNIAFDAIWNSGSGTFLSAGWSAECTGSFNSGASNVFAQNTLLYVERC